MAAAVVMLAGCGTRVEPLRPSAPAPVALQLQKLDDALVRQRYRTLLDFESPSDLVFSQPSDPAPAETAHTGRGAAQITSATTLKIQSLLMGIALPGEWTTLAAYVRPAANDVYAVTLSDGDNVVARARIAAVGGRWNTVWLDLSHPLIAPSVALAKSLRLRIESENAHPFLIDDVLLVDNTRTLLDTTSAGGWKISQRGASTTFDAPGRFRIVVQAKQGSEPDWSLVEYNDIRAVLRSTGRQKCWTLYADGRSIKDGAIQLAGVAPPAAANAHRSPATIEVDESTGRLNTHTEGDVDNSGYNTWLGAYQLVATSHRLQARIVPGSVPAVLPVLEIVGLPPGRVTAVIDGRLIDAPLRLADGRVLLRLALSIERPSTLSVSVTPDNERP